MRCCLYDQTSNLGDEPIISLNQVSRGKNSAVNILYCIAAALAQRMSISATLWDVHSQLSLDGSECCCNTRHRASLRTTSRKEYMKRSLSTALFLRIWVARTGSVMTTACISLPVLLQCSLHLSGNASCPHLPRCYAHPHICAYHPRCMQPFLAEAHTSLDALLCGDRW